MPRMPSIPPGMATGMEEVALKNIILLVNLLYLLHPAFSLSMIFAQDGSEYAQ